MLSVARAGARLGLAALFLVGAAGELQNAVAQGDTRTLSFHHTHTGENITVTFKRNGRYDADGLKKLNWFMRDWRKERETEMDPHLYDLLWEVYREVGATQPIGLICGYRSPETNSMLRARSSGVARNSQHTQGHAIDFYIPGVELAKIRAIGLRLQRGGVGFYPTSGSPFVHMDTGSVRHWPRIARAELMKIFPDGRTVHVPSDGQPLANYALALADVERRGNAPNAVSLASAQEAGVITSREARTAKQPSLLAALFGGNKNKDEAKDEDTASEEPAPRQARTQVASLSAKKVETRKIEANPVPLPQARPNIAVAAVRPAPKPVAVAAAESIFSQRGYWRGAVETGPSLAPAFDVASADATAITGALSFAATGPDVTPSAPTAKAKPMGNMSATAATAPRLPHLTASIAPSTAPNTTVLAKAPLAATMAIGGQQWGSPWLRAAMLTPSVTHDMRTTRLGATDPTWLQSLLAKPAQTLVSTFSDDPHLGMTTAEFRGDAVVFLATATFTNAQTASLR